MIKPLTSLRFFFALMVFFRHLDFFDSKDVEFYKLYNSVFKEGSLGVSFFFILSGFILSFTYQNKIKEGKVTFKDFFVARFARIYPLHFFTLFLTIPLQLWEFKLKPVLWTLECFSNLLLVQSFIPIRSFYFSFNATSWSLSAEIFFYLMFPIIIKYWQKRLLMIWVAMFSLFLIFIICIPDDLSFYLFYINPFFRLIDFVIGILLYDVYKSSLISRLFTSKLSATLVEVFSLTVFSLFFYFHQFIPNEYRYSMYYWVPMSLIILSFSFQKGYLSSLLSGKILIILGEISFGFYLIHQIAIHYFLTFNSKFHIISSDYVGASLIFLSSLATSYFTYKFLEIPANKYIKNKYFKPSEKLKVAQS